jgi:hypothetical protein
VQTYAVIIAVVGSACPVVEACADVDGAFVKTEAFAVALAYNYVEILLMLMDLLLLRRMLWVGVLCYWRCHC